MMARSGRRLSRVCGIWLQSNTSITSVLHGDGTNTVAKKGAIALAISGHKHQKGEKVIAIIDNHGYVLAPVPVAPVNETDMVLLAAGPEGLETGGQGGRVGPERRLSQSRWRL